jgi:ABC-type antimicrobial peptide transport system permease subunit
LVMRHGIVLTLLGTTVGAMTAFGATRYLASLLYGVKPLDPATFIAVATLLLGIALAACFVPARRATRVEPIVALRYE